MKKIFATLIALTTVAAFSAPAMAQTTQVASFQTAIQYDASAPVEDTYKSIHKQARQACKAQIRTVRSLQARYTYLKSCTSELTAAAVNEIEMEALSRYFAKKHGQAASQKYAQMIR